MTVFWYVFWSRQKLEWKTSRWVLVFRVHYARMCRVLLVILVLTASFFFFFLLFFRFCWSLRLRESANSTILKFHSDFSLSSFSLFVRKMSTFFSVYLKCIFVVVLCVPYMLALCRRSQSSLLRWSHLCTYVCMGRVYCSHNVTMRIVSKIYSKNTAARYTAVDRGEEMKN